MILELPIKLEDAEKLLILRTLELKNDNKTHTAKELGIGIRTLQRKLKKFGYYDRIICQHSADVLPQLDSPNGDIRRVSCHETARISTS